MMYNEQAQSVSCLQINPPAVLAPLLQQREIFVLLIFVFIDAAFTLSYADQLTSCRVQLLHFSLRITENFN